MPFRDQLHRLMEEIAGLPEGTVSSSARLLELPGWDSLCGSELRLAIAQEWGVKLKGAEMERCVQVTDVEALLAPHVS